MKDYKISTNRDDFDFEVIYDFISNSYWAKGISREVLIKAIDNSFCFAVLKDSGEQIGFARLVTDKATFAYLADVFILESYRGLGLSKWLIQTIVSQPELQGLRRVLLATKDAQGLYSKYGFNSIENPEYFMEIVRADIYKEKDKKEMN